MGKKVTRGNLEVDWLDKFVLSKQKTVTAAKSEDVDALSSWCFRNSPIIIDTGSLISLRHILGSISSNLNDIALTLKLGYQGNDVSEKLEDHYQDVYNFENLLKQAMRTREILVSTVKQDNSFQYQIEILLNLIDGVIRSTETPNIIQIYENLISNPPQKQNFRQEADPEKLKRFLQEASYSLRNKSDKTLKVIREILQNATDASRAAQRANPNLVQAIYLNTQIYNDPTTNEKYYDINITDNGIGMDWGVVSKDFYVYFGSGKENSEDATGGFGIAKALIQETPEHGWAMNTRAQNSEPVHSNRFHKDLYFTQHGGEYIPPRPMAEITNSGTTLSLFKVPFVEDMSILSLCRKYAGGVTILFNGVEVQPQFDLKTLSPLDGDLSGLSEKMGRNDAEREVARTVINLNADEKKSIADEINGMSYKIDDKYVRIKLYVNHAEYGGIVYVLLNQQFQYESSVPHFENVNIIVNIETNIRPNDVEGYYPIDPGRANLKSPYQEDLNGVLVEIKEITKRVAEHELFKDGLDIHIFNESQNSLSTHEKSVKSKEIAGLEQALTGHSQLFPSEEVKAKDLAENIDRAIQTSNIPMSRESREVVRSFSEQLSKKGDEKIDVVKEIQKIIDGLNTPAAISIQKNFVSREAAHENVALTRNLLILWGRVIKKVIERCAKNTYVSEQQYIPGLIFSDEALALFQPSTRFVPYSTISVNPISVCAIVEPKIFEQKILNSSDIKAVSDANPEDITDTVTPINRLTWLLMHEAIHEATHLLYPDSWGEGQFHRYITHNELRCHSLEREIREDVKEFMQDIRADSRKLITVLRKDKSSYGKQAMKQMLRMIKKEYKSL